MKRWLLALALVAGSLALVACAAQEKAAPAAPAPAAPEAKPAWQQEWEQVLAAAKKEGKVVVAGPTGADERQALTKPFEDKYGITVEWFGEKGSAIAARIKTEREAGQFLWDVLITGMTTQLLQLKPIKALDPIEPALILPEVKDPKSWWQGKIPWGDKEHTNIKLALYTGESMYVNTNQVRDTAQFRSYRDLLAPQWKGKILVGRDPRVSGPGQALFTVFFRHPNLGPDFIRELAKQEPHMLRDDRQAAEWLAQGRFPILIGSDSREIRRMQKQGLPVKIIDARQLKEGTYMSPGSGALTMANRAPHPNAAKVYINWVLSKEGGTLYSKATGDPSLRVDVTREHIEPLQEPFEGAMDIYTEEALPDRGKLRQLLTQIFGR